MNQATKTPMSDHLARFWNLLETEVVRILIDVKRNGYCDSSSFPNDVAKALVAERKGKSLTEDQIKHMVNRFLAWKLPENFNPDGGVSFKKTHSECMPHGPVKYDPSGTNLFDATQADAMVRHMLDGLPLDESACPGHVASDRDQKVCRHCGIHIDSLRPHDDDFGTWCLANCDRIAAMSMAQRQNLYAIEKSESP